MSQRQPKQVIEPGEAPSLATVLRDALSVGILLVDERGHILSCTSEAERLLRRSPGQTSGSELTALPAAIEKIARQATATRQSVPTTVISLSTARNSPVLLVSAFPLQVRPGKIQIVVTLNDFTPIRRIEQNLDRLARLARLGTLSASMAHEIKNALVAVKTFVDLLLEKNRDAELAEIVARELKRIDTLLTQMLRFRAPVRPTFARVRLHDVLDHSLRMLQPQFDTKHISVQRALSAVCDTVQGDDSQLEQAFVNLFFNALEAMEPNGTLKVASENLLVAAADPAGRQICISIADDGIGISPENLLRLFEPFFTTKPNGTGLGMAITRRIIQEHHGRITVSSKPNRGTKFDILLPIQE